MEYVLPAADPSVRVAIVQRSLRQYRAGFYDALRATLAQDGVELLVYHSTPLPHQDPRDDALAIPWSQRLPHRYVRLGRRNLVWQSSAPELRHAQLVIVEQAADLALNYRLLWRQRRGRTRVAFWGHGKNFAEDRSALAEWLKAWASRRVHWWFAYTELSADIVAGIGFDRARITVVENAIDTEQLAKDLEEARFGGAARLREELDLGDGPVAVFLGALRPDKRIDVLLDAAARIHAVREDFRLLVVGAGQQANMVRARADEEPWLHYLGSRYGRDRATVLALADVVLLPGAVGLVMLDSFVAGTPMITSLDSPHGPEIAYMRDGENGLLVAGGSDPERYAQAVLDVIDDPELHARLVAGCDADAKRYSVEMMAERFAEGIHTALARA